MSRPLRCSLEHASRRPSLSNLRSIPHFVTIVFANYTNACDLHMFYCEHLYSCTEYTMYVCYNSTVYVCDAIVRWETTECQWRCFCCPMSGAFAPAAYGSSPAMLM